MISSNSSSVEVVELKPWLHRTVCHALAKARLLRTALAESARKERAKVDVRYAVVVEVKTIEPEVQKKVGLKYVRAKLADSRNEMWASLSHKVCADHASASNYEGVVLEVNEFRVDFGERSGVFPCMANSKEPPELFLWVETARILKNVNYRGSHGYNSLIDIQNEMEKLPEKISHKWLLAAQNKSFEHRCKRWEPSENLSDLAFQDSDAGWEKYPEELHPFSSFSQHQKHGFISQAEKAMGKGPDVEILSETMSNDEKGNENIMFYTQLNNNESSDSDDDDDDDYDYNNDSNHEFKEEPLKKRKRESYEDEITDEEPKSSDTENSGSPAFRSVRNDLKPKIDIKEPDRRGTRNEDKSHANDRDIGQWKALLSNPNLSSKAWIEKFWKSRPVNDDDFAMYP